MIPNENQHAQEPQLTALVYKRCQANSLHSLLKGYKEKVPGLHSPTQRSVVTLPGPRRLP